MVNRLRIAVLGYIVRGPIGGMAWHHLQYVLGLAQLGHDVRFVEDSDDYPSCYNPEQGVVNDDPGYGLQFATAAFDQLGLTDSWAYHDAHTNCWNGPAADTILDWLTRADLLLNISGVNPLRPWLLDIPARALIDTDPAFTQIRHLTDPTAFATAKAHTVFFSFGENIGTARSTVPNDGFPWQPTRQPVVMNAWPMITTPPSGRFTSVMQWESYPAREYNGQQFGMKSVSFQDYLDLPRYFEGMFELAIGSSSAPRGLLRDHGWLLRDPLEVTRSLWTYQEYIHRSKGEFGIAKHGYVVSNCGWFSERSACYLASGRPTVLQNTGFTDWLSAQGGLVAFRSHDEAVAGVAEICRRYEFHAREARAIAAEYFDARKVLPLLVERAMRVGRVD